MALERTDLLDRPADGARTAAVLLQLAEVAAAFAILDRSEADPARTALLAVFAVVLWARTALRVFRVPRESFGWWDAIVTTIGSGAYLVGFTALGVRGPGPTSPVDALAFGLYAVGALLSTGSDVVRTRRAGHVPAGTLCTTGLYAVVRHPKYVGDLAWASGWALATRASLAWLIVGVHAAVLIFIYVPALERRLAGRYGAEYRAWATRTARLIPFLY